MSTPEKCPTCMSSLSPGATKCHACGGVWGEDNRCPHCQALAAVRPGDAGEYVCMACSKPRDVKPGTTKFDHIKGGATKLTAARAAGTASRVFGIMSIGGGLVLGALAWAILPGVVASIVGGVVVAAGVGVGVLAMSAGARAGGAPAPEGTERELAIYALAEQRGGTLSVTDVARTLKLSTADAESALTALADGSRVWVEVTPDGLVQYVFREVAEKIRVRVEETSADTADAELEAAEAEVEAMLSRSPDP